MPCVQSFIVGNGSFKRARLGPLAGFIDDLIDPTAVEEEGVVATLKDSFENHHFDEEHVEALNLVMKYRRLTRLC